MYLVALSFGRRQIPTDLGQTYKGERLVGDSRGLISLPLALAIGALLGGFQERVVEAVHLTVGVDFGTVLNSALKRRLGITPGGNLFPFDQTDFILGASLLYALSYDLPVSTFINGLIVGATLHCFTNLLIRPAVERRMQSY